MRVPKIRKTPARSRGLLPRRVGDAMHGGFEQAVRPFDHAVAEVDDRAAGLRAHVLPVLFGVGGTDGEDLQAAEDVEKGGYAAEVSVRDEAGAAVGGGLGVVFEDADLVAGELGERVEGGQSARGEAEMGFEVLEDEEFK